METKKFSYGNEDGRPLVPHLRPGSAKNIYIYIYTHTQVCVCVCVYICVYIYIYKEMTFLFTTHWPGLVTSPHLTTEGPGTDNLYLCLEREIVKSGKEH